MHLNTQEKTLIKALFRRVIPKRMVRNRPRVKVREPVNVHPTPVEPVKYVPVVEPVVVEIEPVIEPVVEVVESVVESVVEVVEPVEVESVVKPVAKSTVFKLSFNFVNT